MVHSLYPGDGERFKLCVYVTVIIVSVRTAVFVQERFGVEGEGSKVKAGADQQSQSQQQARSNAHGVAHHN
jgi:hypothetical protein